jgi:hypothetical protein
MQQVDFDDFSVMLQSIAEYYGKSMPAGVISIYWQGLKDLDLPAMRRALNAHVQNADTGQFMPKIADVRRMLGGTTQDAAMVAWVKVDRSVRVIGTYSDVVFDDALIHRVISDMGGWVSISSKDDKEWPFIAKEFETRYRGYAMRSERPPYPSILVGMANAANAQGGFLISPPRLVGDIDQCEKTLRNGTDKPLLTFSTLGDVAPVAAGNLRLVSNRAAA